MSDPYAYRPDIELRKEASSENDFAGIENRGGVKLNPQQRQTLQAAVEDYEEQTRTWSAMDDAASNQRKRLDILIKSLDKAISALEANDRINAIVFWRAQLNPVDEIRRLKLLRQHCIDVREELGRPGRKTDFFRLPMLLGQLETVFSEAGGGSTGISRDFDDGTRKSPFIDFAWSVLLLHVPDDMRPASGQALATAWERSQNKIPLTE